MSAPKKPMTPDIVASLRRPFAESGERHGYHLNGCTGGCGSPTSDTRPPDCWTAEQYGAWVAFGVLCGYGWSLS